MDMQYRINNYSRLFTREIHTVPYKCVTWRIPKKASLRRRQFLQPSISDISRRRHVSSPFRGRSERSQGHRYERSFFNDLSSPTISSALFGQGVYKDGSSEIGLDPECDTQTEGASTAGHGVRSKLAEGYLGSPCERAKLLKDVGFDRIHQALSLWN